MLALWPDYLKDLSEDGQVHRRASDHPKTRPFSFGFKMLLPPLFQPNERLFLILEITCHITT